MHLLHKIPAVKVPGVELQFVSITPALAAAWLQRNVKNRKVKTVTLASYVTDMKNQAWLTTHQGVAFNERGELIDGQHRLLAIVESKATVTMLVSTGWLEGGRKKTMDAVDRGVVRSLADQLGLQHAMVNAGEVVKVANALVGCCTGMSKVFKSTTDMVLQVVGIYREELAYVLARPLKDHGLKQATVTACLAMCRAQWPARMDEVIARLQHGENLDRENALLWLRNWLMSGNSQERDVIRATTFYHLVEFIEGRKVKSLVTNTNTAYARVLRLQEARVRKICALYNQLPPEFIRTEEDKRVVLSPIGAEGIKAGQSLRDPFSSLDLSARLDAGNNVGNWLMVWRNRGWIEPASGVGLFKKTERFGV